MTIADKLLTVANNTPAVAEAVNTAKATVSGTTIRVDDVLDVEHPLQVQLRSKNLLDYTKATGRNAAQKVEIVDDGVLWKAGGNYYFEIPVSIPANTTVACSWQSGNDAGEYIYYWVFLYADGTYSPSLQGTNGTSHPSEKDVKSICFYKYTAATALTQDLLVSNIQLELGTTATAYTPYMTDFSGVNITRYGKNLFDDVAFYNARGFELQEDGRWYCSRANVVIFENTYGIPGSFALSGYAETEDSTLRPLVFKFDYTDGSSVYGARVKDNGFVKTTFITDPTKTLSKVTWAFQDSCGYWVKDFQLEYGTATTEYEPYQEPQTATANADGKVTGLSPISPVMTLLTDSAGVSMDCTYLPQSAADTYAKYQQLRAAEIALKEECL